MRRSSGRPGPHPEPPDDLDTRELPIIVRTAVWFRIYSAVYEPLYFGRSGRNRFDDPLAQFGVLYLGSDPHCSFIETFGQDPGKDYVTVSSLRKRSLCQVEFHRPLQLVDLTGPGLAWLGADGRLCSGDHAVAQRWSRALWRHPSKPDGLIYRARHDPSRSCLALYERAADAARVTPLGSLLDRRHTALLAEILGAYRFGLVDDGGI